MLTETSTEKCLPFVISEPVAFRSDWTGVMKCQLVPLCVLIFLSGAGASFVAAQDAAVGKSVVERFATKDSLSAPPDFQKHVVPLLGKLGCNGRACHGSFQGRGGFRLSLFGYDFNLDHEELQGRINPVTPAESLALQKPLMQIPHEGGQRIKSGSWEHHLLVRWIETGATGRATTPPELRKLEVTPAEILFSDEGQQQPLKVIAIWTDGTQEDVSALTRFQTSDDQIADVSPSGVVTSGMRGDTHVVAYYDNAVVPIPVIRPVSDQFGDQHPTTPTPTHVDELVVARLRKLGIVQSDLCTDAEFLRRASLDVTGTLPTPHEVREFLAAQSADKRARKIDELLERPGYVAWWTTKLCDFTGNSDDKLNNVTPVQNQASQQWYAWLEKRVRENVAYDKIVEGIVMAVGREPGESYRQYCENLSKLYHKDGPGAAGYADRSGLTHFWARQNFQTSEDRVIGFAYTFLGTRIQCAQCHKHPFDQWTQEDFTQFEGFFKGAVARQVPRPDARATYDSITREVEGAEGLKGNDLRRVFAEKVQAGGTIPFPEVFTRIAPPVRQMPNKKNEKQAARGEAIPATAKVLAGPVIRLSGYKDTRQPLVAWLLSPENPFFARAFVNRVWANYFNAGIVDPADDLSLGNPPSNPPLLNYLAQGFIEQKFDMKWLHREILNSRTYQLSWVSNETNRLDGRHFSHAVPRRIPAEITFDMMVQATGNTKKNATVVTSLEKRAVTIPGGGMKNRNRTPADYAMAVFGRSTRETNCDCDRTAEPSLLQTIFVRNDGQLLSMIDDHDGWLQEVATEHHLTFNRKSVPFVAGREKVPVDRKQQVQAQVRRLKARLAMAEKEGKRVQANALRQQIAKVKEQARKNGFEIAPETADKVAAKTEPPMPSDEGAPPEPADEVISSGGAHGVELAMAAIVDEAYLRTLSRYPTPDEMAIAKKFIAESADSVDGIRSVLWALVNTREFLVNH